MALRRCPASIGCRYRVRRGFCRTVNNKVIMLIEDITLSDYSDDELSKFINEAQEVLRDRKNKQLYKKMDEFAALFNELTKKVYLTYYDEDSGVTHSFELAKVTSKGQYPEVTFYADIDD